MRISDLLAMANETISNHQHANQDSIDDRLVLSIPEPVTHNGYRVRLFGNKGPLAVVVNGSRGRLTVYVSARRLRSYLTKRETK